MYKIKRISAADYRNGLCGGTDRHTYRNSVSSALGRGFENQIHEACQYYARQGQAIISKVPEQYIVTKNLSDGMFVGRFTGRAEPDYKGVLAGGQAIAFEAKSTNKSRIQRSALTQNQMDWLKAQHDMGALAYVCVNIKDKYFMVPWVVWDKMKHIFEKKFLMAEDINMYEVKFDGILKFLEYKSGLGNIGDSIYG